MGGRRRQVDLIESHVTDGDLADNLLFSLPPPSPSSCPLFLVVGACDRVGPPERKDMDRPNNPIISLVTSKDWTLESMVAFGPRFRTVDKISANSGTPEQIVSAIKDYEQRGIPLVVQDFHGHSDWPEFFTPQWLESHYGSQSACTLELSVQGVLTSCLSVVEAHNVHGERPDKKLTVTELIDSVRNAPRFAHQGGMACYPTPTPPPQLMFLPERERLYGKDMHCPAEWRGWIKTSGVLPDMVIPGATDDILPETVETLMSYLGVSDTCTYGLRGPVYGSLTQLRFSSHTMA